MIKQQLQLKLSQKLSPQQIQLMKLIQLSTQELEQKIQSEIGENPALENGKEIANKENEEDSYEDRESIDCLLYTSPSPRDISTARMPSAA